MYKYFVKAPGIILLKLGAVIVGTINQVSSKIKIYGVNLGSGRGWSYPFWIGLDQLDGEYLDENTVLPFKDSTISAIYSSHFIEHVSDDVALNLFQESYRVLKPGGVIRLVSPDFENIKKAIVEQDKTLFESIKFNGRPEWKKYGILPTIENKALHWFANYDNKPYLESELSGQGLDFYRGPPKIQKQIVYEKACTLDTLSFGNWVISHIPKNFIGNGGHINTWTHNKICNFLEQAGGEGWRNKGAKEYCQSKSKYMAKFDTIPSRKDISIYYEAIKK
jgi:predicted SAM-dependent methyltransferase